jgi:hypothetical protein
MTMPLEVSAQPRWRAIPDGASHANDVQNLHQGSSAGSQRSGDFRAVGGA